eukprot:TRINITY_DN15507_c0_g1_i8.p1 TRINITY_DN15507_c0_g1~~TRINITY_DN15507_c0_g1_i8.p1  ORF type:complete len:294 (+),score=45.65 TRINITY_DN15507_c0_g1_i8:188-1069(+)
MKVLDAAGARPDLPVAEGFQQALLEPLHHCPSIHGEDGVGDLQPPLQESSRTPHTEHAVQLLLKTLHAAPKEPGLVVIALGPLTNIAVAIRTDPAVWHKKCSKLVWMGGAVSIGGNSTAWGEANAFCDPEAAQIVLSSGLNIMMYPWDVFTKPAFSKQELEEMGLPDVDAESEKKLRDGCPPWSHLASRLLHGLMHIFQATSATIGDAGAVASLVCPDAVTIKRMHIEVELHGQSTRGMTVADQRPFPGEVQRQREANIDVVVDIDASKLKELYARCVLKERRLEATTGGYNT